MSNPHYSLTVAEVLDSPIGYLALMAVPVGLYLMFKILLWDYTVSQVVRRFKFVPFSSAVLLGAVLLFESMIQSRCSCCINFLLSHLYNSKLFLTSVNLGLVRRNVFMCVMIEQEP